MAADLPDLLMGDQPIEFKWDDEFRPEVRAYWLATYNYLHKITPVVIPYRHPHLNVDTFD